MAAIIKQKTKTLRSGKKKIIIEIDRELTELTESDKIKIEIYFNGADEKEIITPSDKKEKERKGKNIKPETKIKNSITKQEIENYIKDNDPNGLEEYNNQDLKNYMKLKQWFFNKYPDFIEKKLKQYK